MKKHTITINNPNRSNKDSNYPSNTNDHDKSSSNYSGGLSYGGSKNTGYSPQELHVINTVKALGNSVLGASTHDSRKEKAKDGYNASLKLVVESIKYSGYTGQKGLLFSDNDLTAHDMNYLSATMPSNNYNFTLVDFSHNPKIGALGVDYLIKGQDGINHLKDSQTALNNHNQGKPMMFMGKPFIIPPEMLKSMMEQAKTINPDDYTYKGLLTRGNFNAVIIDISNCNIGDIGADIIGNAIYKGRMPNVKHIDVSGNNITPNGKGIIARTLNKLDKGIAITIEKFSSSAKDLLQSSAKAMLFIAKSNGIETKDVLTTQETVEHCKKGFPNVGKNIAVGLAKCNNIFVKYTTPQDVTLQDIGTDIISIVFPQTAPALNAYCNTEKVFFSVVDEDFAHCLEGLIGVDSNLNN